MKKVLLALLVMAMLAVPAMAQTYRGHTVQIVDEFGRAVTDITSITVFNNGLGTSPTIYNDRAGTLTVTNPITTSSTNSTFDQATGTVRWFQRAPDFKLTITDGTKTLTFDGLNELDTRIPWYINYIGTAASLSVNDNQSITVGTDSDMVLAWNNGSDFMSWIPAADGSAYNLGTSGTGKNVDFNWFVGTALGIKGNEGTATLTVDGVDVLINATGAKDTSIASSTGTGAVTIGSSTSGVLGLDTASSMTINADDSIAMTVSAGTITVAATGGDITIDGVDKSVIIRGTEAIADAIWIDADAGGIDITTAATFDIDVTATGGKILLNATENAAGAISATVNGGSSETIVLTNTQGTGEDAFNIDATAGGIDIDFATAKNMAVTGGQFIFTSNEDVASAFSVITNTGTSETITIVNTQGTGTGAITLTTTAAGDLDINSGDDITIDAADDMTTTVGGDYTLAVTGDTILPNDVLLKTITALTHDHMDNLAGTPKEVVAAVAGNTIEFVSAILALDYGATPWTEASAPDDLVIRYTDGNGAIVSHLLDATGFATATEDTVVFLGSNVSDAAGADVASVAVTEAASTNQGLFLDNTGDEWTNSGDSQVVVIVYYRLHTTAELGL